MHNSRDEHIIIKVLDVYKVKLNAKKVKNDLTEFCLLRFNLV